MSKQKVFDMVKAILTDKPEARDNDMYLTAIVWFRDLQRRQNINAISLVDFFHIMRNYKTYGLLSFETISRGRRLVQEAHMELRGENYDKRHKKQDEVKQDLRAIKTEALFGNASESKPDEQLLGGQMPMFGDL